MTPPRAYVHHSTKTITYLRNHYHRATMAEISVTLGIPANKLYKLAERENIQKRKGKK